jgi:hypothetical protein
MKVKKKGFKWAISNNEEPGHEHQLKEDHATLIGLAGDEVSFKYPPVDPTKPYLEKDGE